MAYKKNEIKTGLMIIASLLVLGLFLVAIFGIDFSSDTRDYKIFLQYVGGISEGSLVKYRGMDVGQVKEIALPNEEEGRIVLTLEILKNTPIKSDSRAFVTSLGLMAEQHIEITAGTSRAELLPPGSVIESKEVLNFAQMTETMGDLNQQIQMLINRVSDLFNDENRSHLSSVMGNIDTLMRESRQPLLATVSNMEKTSREFAEISAEIRQMMKKNEGSMEDILTNLEAVTASSQQLILDLQTTVGSLEATMSSNNSNLYEIMENLEMTSQNMEEFSRMLKEQPWLLVRKSAPPEREF